MSRKTDIPTPAYPYCRHLPFWAERLKTTKGETKDMTEHLGGSYLKTGQLKANRDGSTKTVRCVIDGRKGGPRIVPARENQHGKFPAALEIPTSIEGQDFILSMPADKGDGLTLTQVFGPVGPEWVGKAITVQESELLDRLRIQPVG